MQNQTQQQHAWHYPQDSAHSHRSIPATDTPNQYQELQTTNHHAPSPYYHQPYSNYPDSQPQYYHPPHEQHQPSQSAVLAGTALANAPPIVQPMAQQQQQQQQQPPPPPPPPAAAPPQQHPPPPQQHPPQQMYHNQHLPPPSLPPPTMNHWNQQHSAGYMVNQSYQPHHQAASEHHRSLSNASINSAVTQLAPPPQQPTPHQAPPYSLNQPYNSSDCYNYNNYNIPDTNSYYNPAVYNQPQMPGYDAQPQISHSMQPNEHYIPRENISQQHYQQSPAQAVIHQQNHYANQHSMQGQYYQSSQSQMPHQGQPQPPMMHHYSQMPSNTIHDTQVSPPKKQTRKKNQDPNAPTTRRKRTPKDPNMAKEHKKSGYAKFFSIKQKEYKKKNPEDDFSAISKSISAQWSALTDEEKAPYIKDVSVKRREHLKKKATQQVQELLGLDDAAKSEAI